MSGLPTCLLHFVVIFKGVIGMWDNIESQYSNHLMYCSISRPQTRYGLLTKPNPPQYSYNHKPLGLASPFRFRSFIFSSTHWHWFLVIIETLTKEKKLGWISSALRLFVYIFTASRSKRLEQLQLNCKLSKFLFDDEQL